MPTVLHVAEKNSVAKPLAEILSTGHFERRQGPEKYCPLYFFVADFQGRRREHVVTSVRGHMHGLEFQNPNLKRWSSCDPVVLFDEPVCEFVPDDLKNLEKQLQKEAKNCDTIVLWLDCDREGEAIGAEVVQICTSGRQQGTKDIFRAQFSVVNTTEIHRALRGLRRLNMFTVDAVKARQEIDLRLGAIFTRFQTLLLQNKYQFEGVASYGPCQFPTLGFVVNRFNRIQNFHQESFWKLMCEYGDRSRKEGGVGFAEFIWKRATPGIFDRGCAIVFLDACVQNPIARVTKVLRNPTSKWRPVPLATTQMSICLNRWRRISAQRTLDAAEKLYQAGCISYPRTETEIFRPEFEFEPLVSEQCASPVWGMYAQKLLQTGVQRPRQGAGDDNAHPPIHPVKYVSLDSLASQDERDVYEFVVRHFLACCSANALGSKTDVEIAVATESFSLNGLQVLERNYLEVYVYEKWTGKVIPNFDVGQVFEPSSLELKEGRTTPPDLLKEYDLLKLMERSGIGTDATMAQHIETIKKRNYVVQTGDQFLRPTAAGVGLVRAYQFLEMDFPEPNLRSAMEADCKLIEAGEKTRALVVSECLREMKRRFQDLHRQKNVWVRKYGEYAARDTPRRPPSGQVLMEKIIACLECGNYMDLKEDTTSHVSGRESRSFRFLFCKQCEHSLLVPSKGRVAATDKCCPLCEYTVLRFENESSYYVCPACYNNPPDGTKHETNGRSKMPCFQCRNPQCELAGKPEKVVKESCGACRKNAVVLKSKEYRTGVQFRATCKGYPSCKAATFLPVAVKDASLPVSPRACSNCGFYKLLITIKGTHLPPGEQRKCVRCVNCDDLLNDLRGGSRNRPPADVRVHHQIRGMRPTNQ
jgi:DNA topoisomerase III